MASSWVVDAWGWISSLPPIAQWKTNTISLRLCSPRPPQPPLILAATKSLQNQSPYIFFFLAAELDHPLSLWTSASLVLKSHRTTQQQPLDEGATHRLFSDIVAGVLRYGPSTSRTASTSFRRLPSDLHTDEHFEVVFNLAFLTLTLLVCIYEAPQDLRAGWLEALRLNLESTWSKEAAKELVRLLGSNLEEQWMRALGLAVTNQMLELQGSSQPFKVSPPLFSYASSTATGLWKVQLYCPVAAMGVEDASAKTADERLLFSLRYQQLEGVVQLANRVVFRENWIDVTVSVDNIRWDVKPLVSDTLMAGRGHGPEEKHFPSRVSLQLTPTLQSHVLSVSVSRSSDNPVCEVGHERVVEGSFEPPNSSLGLRLSAAETVSMSMRPWKFEQSVSGSSASFHWFLHDGNDGREVFSSRPPRLALFQPRAWFRDRYSSAYRPFTKQGGVVFAGDEYGETIGWKLGMPAAGRTMEWQIRGSIWLTYWPNKRRSFYSETRRMDFQEIVRLPLCK